MRIHTGAARPLLALALAALLIPACGKESGSRYDTTAPPAPPLPPVPQPDFSLQDVNPNSATFSTNVSPRDYLTTKVPAFYFGHAT